ncbi:hypothetical protein OIU77_026227 [Salix suchowensis]|uniref:Protein kinase domain-containing protein n=1 Tax=Salix suchowensis TaxID=1278906 RepID=A0ABQ9C132_9ROSI|nr:hypothetical protein OIU77_026227 [Salix suchowensis]
MSCFSCINPHRKDIKIDIEHAPRSSSRYSSGYSGGAENGKGQSADEGARSFTFRELAAATRNFREINLIGEGGFGRVYKGRLETGEIVAVKQLNQDGLQGHQEFIVEVLMLSLLHHSNLVTLIGYCTSGDQRLLVYEYMPMGSLEDHLFDLEPDKEPLTWSTRMKIAVGPVGENTHVSTRVMGTYGYCRSKKPGEQNLVAWSRPIFERAKEILSVGRSSVGRVLSSSLFELCDRYNCNVPQRGSQFSPSY